MLDDPEEEERRADAIKALREAADTLEKRTASVIRFWHGVQDPRRVEVAEGESLTLFARTSIELELVRADDPRVVLDP